LSTSTLTLRATALVGLTPSKRTITDCVRCGICKARCPSYEELSKESFGARGRVALINQLLSSGLTHTKDVSHRIFTCLLCGACNDLCPLGIDITGAIYEIRAQARLSQKRLWLMGLFVEQLLKRPELTFTALKIISLLGRYLPVGGYLSKLKDLRLEIPHSPLSKTLSISKAIKPIGRVAVFAGCTVNFLLPTLGFTLTEVLNTLGYDVVIPRSSLCCGAPLLSMGTPEAAKVIAKRHIETLSGLSVEMVITLCPTCVYTMKEGYRRLIGQGIKHITDSTAFIYQNWDRLRPNCEDLGLVYLNSLINYHHPCHTINYLHHKKEGPFILRGLGLELAEQDRCCGFGGPFRFLYGKVSMDIVKRRYREFGSQDMIVTSCPSCILQFRGAGINSRHFIELIKIALRS